MASHIPLALSLLGSFAGYPLSSGTQTTASIPLAYSVAPSASPQVPGNAPAVPSAPIHTSGPIPSTNPNAPHNSNSTLGTSPPTTNSAASALCEVSTWTLHRFLVYESNIYNPRFVKCVPNTLMEPKYIRSAAKHVRARDLVLMGVGRTLLLVLLLLPLLGIAMYVEHFSFWFMPWWQSKCSQ